MSRIMRLTVGVILVLVLLVVSSVPALAASSKGGTWRARPIIILCDGYPTACPCPGC